MYNQIENFLDEYKHKGMAENTVKAYEIHLRHYYSYLKQKDLDYKNIKTKDIRKYTRASTNRGDTNGTVNVRLSAIKSFYDYLIDDEIMEYNPITKAVFLKHKPLKTKPLTPEEKNMILTYMESKDKHIELGFKVLFATGLRVSELANLKREDVKIINNRAVVHVIHTKRDKERYVPVFDPEVAQDLLNYTEEQLIDPLFKVKKRTFQYHAEQAGKNLDILFNIHQTRYTFATERLQEGIRLDILQKLLGHKDISTTLLYAKTLDIDIINAAAPIETLMEERKDE
ncbi:MAG: tyrosine-type recombinase/integrase [Tissierellia bacterium]|nr:tyrosine-type recombinase/integrase [Tissierellia bacterium]